MARAVMREGGITILLLCCLKVDTWQIVIASRRSWKNEDFFFQVSAEISYILVGSFAIYPILRNLLATALISSLDQAETPSLHNFL